MTDSSPSKLDQEIYICTASLVTEVPIGCSTLSATPSSSVDTATGTEAAATSEMTSPTACPTPIATTPTGCPLPISTTSINYHLPFVTTTTTTSLVPITASPTTGPVCTTTSSSSAGSADVVPSKGVCRRRSFKRHAPPPPSASTAAAAAAAAASLGTQAASLLSEEECSSASNSVASAEELQGSMSSSAPPLGAPPAPERSVSSHEATRKHQGFASVGPQSYYEYNYDGVRGYPPTYVPTESSVNDYEFVDYGTGRADLYQSVQECSYSPESYPPYALQYAQVAPRAESPPTYGCSGVKPINPWEQGLQHSWSDGSVQYHHHHQRRPKPPSFARPLVPVLEEGVSASSDTGAANVVRRPFSPPPLPLLSPTPQTPPPHCYPPPAASRKTSMTETPGQARPRLDRSDSLVTVAHLYEDLLVVSPRLRVTLTNITVMVVVAAIALPNTAALLYTFFRLVFGTLFPAYYSYKAVKTKNVKEYVKWMMYWIVFAFFTCFETITDLLVAFWFPFYYELKILLVLWLLSPATRGSSVLYRKFVHPWLTQREGEIDECIAKAKQQGYSTVLQLGTKGVNYATAVIMQTAIKGGGGLVNQLKRSYSVGELAAGESDDHMDGGDYGGKHAPAGDMNRNNVKALPSGTAYYDEEYSAHGHLSQQYQHLPPPPHAGITTATAAPSFAQPQGVAASCSSSSSPPAATCSSGELFSPADAATTVLNRRVKVEEQPSSSDGEGSCDGTDTGKVDATAGRMATRSMSTARGGKRGGISRTRLFF